MALTTVSVGNSRRVRLPSSQVKNPIYIFKRKTARRHLSRNGRFDLSIVPLMTFKFGHHIPLVITATLEKNTVLSYTATPPLVNQIPPWSRPQGNAYPQMSQMYADKTKFRGWRPPPTPDSFAARQRVSRKARPTALACLRQIPCTPQTYRGRSHSLCSTSRQFPKTSPPLRRRQRGGEAAKKGKRPAGQDRPKT